MLKTNAQTRLFIGSADSDNRGEAVRTGMNETNILSIFGNFSVVRTEARELQHTLSEMNGIKYEKCS